MKVINYNQETIIASLSRGEVIYMLTDTIPGLVARAEDENAVARIFELKQRSPKAQLPTLISSFEHIDALGAKPHSKSVYKKHWPGPNTLVHEATDTTPGHIERGNGEFGIRWPDSSWLQELISIVGPLSATSANPQGKPSSLELAQSIAYFGDSVDLYVDHPPLAQDTPSSVLLIAYDTGEIQKLS